MADLCASPDDRHLRSKRVIYNTKCKEEKFLNLRMCDGFPYILELNANWMKLVIEY
jgi:hypothetical protein